MTVDVHQAGNQGVLAQADAGGGGNTRFRIRRSGDGDDFPVPNRQCMVFQNSPGRYHRQDPFCVNQEVCLYRFFSAQIRVSFNSIVSILLVMFRAPLKPTFGLTLSVPAGAKLYPETLSISRSKP